MRRLICEHLCYSSISYRLSRQYQWWIAIILLQVYDNRVKNWDIIPDWFHGQHLATPRLCELTPTTRAPALLSHTVSMQPDSQGVER